MKRWHISRFGSSTARHSRRHPGNEGSAALSVAGGHHALANVRSVAVNGNLPVPPATHARCLAIYCGPPVTPRVRCTALAGVERGSLARFGLYGPVVLTPGASFGRRGWERMRGLLIAAEADDWSRNREAIARVRVCWLMLVSTRRKKDAAAQSRNELERSR